MFCAHFVHTIDAPEHTTKSLPRYTNMGIKNAYPDPTNTFVVLKTISNTFCAHFLLTMGAPEHAMSACEHATKSLPRYTNMGIKYAYPDPTNTYVVIKIYPMYFVHIFCSLWVLLSTL